MKKEVYKIGLIASNFLLVIAVFFVAFYLIAPLLGGKLFVDAIVRYASWIGLALTAKIVLKRVQKGLQIRAYDYVIACLSAIINFVLWFTYPMNIILSVLCIIIVAISYKVQSKRIQNDLDAAP